MIYLKKSKPHKRGSDLNVNSFVEAEIEYSRLPL